MQAMERGLKMELDAELHDAFTNTGKPGFWASGIAERERFQHLYPFIRHFRPARCSTEYETDGWLLSPRAVCFPKSTGAREGACG
jgi:hypothetical protein